MILKECFTDAFITSQAGDNIDKKRIYEKVVHAFYLLEKVADTGLPFVFKGGTSLMLLLKEFNRFSVDIDILMKPEYEEEICKTVLNFKDDVFIDVKEDKRKPADIIKRHFKFFFNSIYDEKSESEPYVLLDIVFDDLHYKNTKQYNIDSKFVKTDNPYLQVAIPDINEMLGDKLTAFAPKTIGILYSKPDQIRSKHVEIIKQLYDISKLYDNITNLEDVKETYIAVAKVQIKNRGLDLTYEDALKDTIETCKLIITQDKKKTDSESYAILSKGYEGFKNFTVNNFTFQELITMAVKVYILAISLLYTSEFSEEEKPINCFVGREYKIIRQRVGLPLYSKFMQACYIENQFANKDDK